jgi:hypothetical protein
MLRFPGNKIGLMTVLHNLDATRLLAVILLLVFPPGVSEIVCISPVHQAVESWATICCGPLSEVPGPGFKEPTVCHGCTDYAVVPSAETGESERHSPRVIEHGSPALLAAACMERGQAIAHAGAVPPRHAPSPLNVSPPANLRC